MVFPRCNSDIVAHKGHRICGVQRSTPTRGGVEALNSGAFLDTTAAYVRHRETHAAQLPGQLRAVWDVSY